MSPEFLPVDSFQQMLDRFVLLVKFAVPSIIIVVMLLLFLREKLTARDWR